jgi:hypothetical protein
MQWRVCFVWTEAGPENVEIVDRHWREAMCMTILAPIHPGEVLLEEFIEPLDVTQHHVAVAVVCRHGGCPSR